MSVLHIPFVAGQHEEADAKLLPQGMLVRAENVRARKDARFGVRSAYRQDVAGPAISTVNNAAWSEPKLDLVFQKRSAPNGPPRAYAHTPVGWNFADFNDLCMGGGLSVFERQTSQIGLLPSQNGIGSCDVTVSGSYAYVAYFDYVLASKLTGSSMYVAKVNLDNGAIIRVSGLITATGSNCKILFVNGVLMLFWAENATDTVQFAALDLTVLSFTASGTVVTSSIGRSRYFDVSPGGAATEAYLIHQSAANTLQFGTVSTAGVFAALNTIATTNTEARPSITPTGNAPTDQIAIIWLDGATFTSGNAKYTVYRRSTTSFITATTTIDASGVCTGYPVIGSNTTDDWRAAWNRAAIFIGSQRKVGTFRPGGAVEFYANMALSSKPFQAGTLFAALTTSVDDVAAAAGSFYAMDISYQGNAGGSLSGGCEAVFAPFEAAPADIAANVCDPRRKVVAVAANGSAPGLSAVATVLPLIAGNTNGWVLYRSEYGDRADVQLPARLNGELIFSGGVITNYDGRTIAESGLDVPIIYLATQTGGGAIADGTYQVVFVWEFFDGAGRRHRSSPSLPSSVTTGGGSNNITVYFGSPHATGRNLIEPRIRLRVYRTTLAQTTIFQDAIGYALPLGTPGTITSFTLTAIDAVVSTNEVLYTQGSRGGLSGLLENDRPPAAKFLWAGSDRLIAGGLEKPNGYQLSKLRQEGEPMEWADFDAYKGNVDGRVTAVSEMDGTYWIGTANGWWSVSGPGPDDNGGGGAFDVPRRLPTDIGCISHKSLVMVGQGLIFQGAADRMYLLPRGGGTPTPIGWQVRDTLAAFPYISAAVFDPDSNVAYWAICNTAGSAGRLLVYDTRLNEWFVDNVSAGRAIKALSLYDGKLEVDGTMIETPGSFADDAGSLVTVIPVLETGDMRPFGAQGWGRIVRTTLLGEARDVSVAWTLTLDVSYDSGKTYAEQAQWPVASLAVAIGDAIDGAEHMFVQQRVAAVRNRWSWTTPSPTEGLVFNAQSLEVLPAAGLKRQPNSTRAA